MGLRVRVTIQTKLSIYYRIVTLTLISLFPYFTYFKSLGYLKQWQNIYRPTCFLFCEDCSYHKNTEKIISESDLNTLDEIKNNISKFKCPKCGSKQIIIKEKPRREPKIEYVATEQTTKGVFHRSSCGWMRNVTSENEIRFKTKEEALKRGFRSCKSCRS